MALFCRSLPACALYSATFYSRTPSHNEPESKAEWWRGLSRMGWDKSADAGNCTAQRAYGCGAEPRGAVHVRALWPWPWHTLQRTLRVAFGAS